MRIAVTGGTGFIGQYLLEQADENHIFVVMTSRDNIEKLAQSPYVEYKKISYEYDGFFTVLEDCDAVIHLGAVRSDAKMEESFFNYMTNIETSEALFHAAKDANVKNIVNVSSTAVYDASLEMPFSEASATAPLSYYGVSKLTIEQIAHRYNEKYGMCIKSLRVGQALGIGEREGYMPAVFLKRCLDQEKLLVYGSGQGGKEYVYVKDIVTALLCACHKSDIKGVFNVGTGVLTTNRELAETYCKVFENKAGFELLLDKPDVLTRHYMDVEKAKNELGFSAKYSLEKALIDMKERVLK